MINFKAVKSSYQEALNQGFILSHGEGAKVGVRCRAISVGTVAVDEYFNGTMKIDVMEHQIWNGRKLSARDILRTDLELFWTSFDSEEIQKIDEQVGEAVEACRFRGNN